MKTLMGLAGLTMAGFMLLSCNTEVNEKVDITIKQLSDTN